MVWDPYAEFQSATLPNGLTVYASNWPGRPWENVRFLVHSGAECDPIGFEGTAHFVEHLISKNTTIPYQDIKVFFEDQGGSVELGMTGYPFTSYHFFAPMDKMIMTKAFSLFGEMLFSSKLENFIERERQVIIGEFNRKYPLKLDLDIETRWRKSLYDGYRMKNSVLGTPESIKRISRDELQSYYDTYYTPANMSIVCVGGMTLEEIMKILSESPFAMKKDGVRVPLLLKTTAVTRPTEVQYSFKMSDVVATPVESGRYASIAKVPAVISGQTINIAKMMIGKILFREVREQRAWAYSITCSHHNFQRFHEFSIDCKAFDIKALNEFEKVVDDCITSIGEDAELLEQKKRCALANMLDTSGKGLCDGATDDLINHQRIISVAGHNEGVDRVTMKDIREVIDWLRPKQRWTLVVHP